MEHVNQKTEKSEGKRKHDKNNKYIASNSKSV